MVHHMMKHLFAQPPIDNTYEVIIKIITFNQNIKLMYEIYYKNDIGLYVK